MAGKTQDHRKRSDIYKSSGSGGRSKLARSVVMLPELQIGLFPVYGQNYPCKQWGLHLLHLMNQLDNHLSLEAQSSVTHSSHLL